MKIAVIGGAGKVVWGAIRDFVEHEDVKQILLADLNLEAIEARQRSLNSEKVLVSKLDLNDHSALVTLLEDYDVCLNATSHHFNMKVMAACLESRTHYTDFGGLFHWARQQLEMDEQFREAGITGIVGSGSAPGIVNVMARYAYDHLDTLETIKILDGIVNFNITEDMFVPPYAIDTLLDEFEMSPYEFVAGEFVEMEPFSGEEWVDFPEPIGRQKVINTIHSEVATMPISFQDKGIQNVAFKLSLPKIFEEQLKFLTAIGLGSAKSVDVRGQQVVPRQLLASVLREGKQPVFDKHDDHKALRVVAEGTKDGVKCKYVIDTVISPYEKWSDMSQGVFSVGFPAAVTTRMLGAGQITKRGFFPSEGCIDPEIYFNELEKRGIYVYANLIRQI